MGFNFNGISTTVTIDGDISLDSTFTVGDETSIFNKLTEQFISANPANGNSNTNPSFDETNAKDLYNLNIEKINPTSNALRCSMEMNEGSTNSSWTFWVSFFVNGTYTGIVLTANGNAGYVTRSADIPVNEGDLLSVKVSGYSAGGFSRKLKNFKITGNIASGTSPTITE